MRKRTNRDEVGRLRCFQAHNQPVGRPKGLAHILMCESLFRP
jgi:hypothetical protein